MWTLSVLITSVLLSTQNAHQHIFMQPIKSLSQDFASELVLGERLCGNTDVL